ncbi:tail fiber protein [Salmonella phage DaR-2019a]|nr:tail fiber protein [Salmonella phage DaR-2019a]
MADYKLSELNSIDTIRSDDLLHVRVKKRPEMLGDEDRRMTYQDFLASFKLERFVQIAGSIMTGDLGIVKLLYGGKAVFDPTGSSEITIGDVLKTFKLNANGLKLTIADASRSATVYHTLNKPSPNELGMRTNEENDARYARLAVTNNFNIRQAIIIDGEQLTLKKATNAGASYIQGRDANNQQTWYVGQGKENNTNVYLYNHATGSMLTLDATASFNKTLRITGQVQPSDWTNIDSRYIPVATLSTIARTNATNTFSGTQNIQSDGNALRLRNQIANNAQYIEGVNLDGSARWWVGIGSNGADAVNLYNNKYDSALTVASNISVNKSLAITGQVQPSDFSNLDARYFTQTVANQRFAQLTANNNFTGTNTFSRNLAIISDSAALRLKNATSSSLFIQGVDSQNTNRWYVGNGDNTASVLLHNYVHGSNIRLDNGYISVNQNFRITGQVQPSDFSNLDARYFTQSASDSRYLRIRSTGFNQGNGEKWAKIATVVMPQSASTAVIEVFGGSGFDVNTPHQAGKCEIILRTSNNNPKGLNAVAWRISENTIVTDIGYVNTSGDTYDIYCRVGTYQNGTTSRVQSSSNASVQLFEFPQTSDDAPQGIVKGTIAKYYTSLQKPTPSDIGAYTKAETDQKIAQAVSDSTDLNKIYPVGIVTWFNSNVNPNTALPGLTWTYLNNGVGRTIRIAAANGSDVATTGGSDSVTLAVGNLPSHTHSFSATTSSFDYGTKTTNTTGAHTHSVSGSTNNTGAHTHTVGGHYGGDSIGGKQRVQVSGTQQVSSSDGAHSHTVSGTAASNGNHAHTVGIGAHSHTVSGNTGGTGSGSAFSVTNQFYKLMAWVRTA